MKREENTWAFCFLSEEKSSFSLFVVMQFEEYIVAAKWKNKKSFEKVLHLPSYNLWVHLEILSSDSIELMNAEMKRKFFIHLTSYWTL